MSRQRCIPIMGWLDKERTAAELTVWPIEWRAAEVAEMKGRMTIAISTGVASLHIRPNAAEVRQLIEALQWALESAEVQA